jgi:hypothetical protein
VSGDDANNMRLTEHKCGSLVWVICVDGNIGSANGENGEN